MRTERRRVVAERDGRGWLVMWPDGSVEWCASKAAVLRAVKRTATADIDVAEVEWRSR